MEISEDAVNDWRVDPQPTWDLVRDHLRFQKFLAEANQQR